MTPFFESPQQVGGLPQVVIYNAPWEEVWPTLGLAHEDVALVWGDVPYGAKEKTKRSTRRSDTPTVNGGYGETGRDWRPVAGDNGPFDPAPLLAFPRLVLWGANYYANRLPPSSTWWWWGKREGTTPDDNGDGELAWTNLGGPPREFQHLWRGLCQGSEKAHGGKRLHPTQKPVALSTWGFQQARLRPGQLVFSPYMGSGPEVASALHLGLCIIACELEREYCEACVSARVRQSALPLELLELPRPAAREVRLASPAEQASLSLFTPSGGGR